MDKLIAARTELNTCLDEAVRADALEALKTIGEVERDLADRQRTAVRTAAAGHTWAEIGAALGVTRQAAHHRFAKEWAETLKAEVKAGAREEKAAIKRGDLHAAQAARQSREAAIAEIRAGAKAQKRKRR